MILNREQNNVVIDTEEESVKMNISASSSVQDHIIKLLTESGYKKPIESLVRESVCNGIDSHVEAGLDEPVLVRLYRNGSNWIFEVEDFGVGLSEEEFYKYCMNIGESTKRHRTDLIGAMGAGFKSCMAYANSFETIARKDGKETKFVIFKGKSRPESNKLYERPTTERNGVLVRLQLKSIYDKDSFVTAIKKQLPYFPGVSIQIEGDSFKYNECKLFRNDLFEWSEIYPSNELHISFGGVNYPIAWDVLGISRINLPVGIRIPLDSGITPIFNREELIYTEETKTLILGKIKAVAEWFVSRYNENIKKFDKFLDAYEYIDPYSHIVPLEGKNFDIDNFIDFLGITVKDVNIPHIKLKSPKWYKNHIGNLDDDYVVSAHYDYNYTWKTKRIRTSVSNKIIGNRKVVLLSDTATHYEKKFLMDKYENDTLFVVRNQSPRRLWTGGMDSYYHLLNLRNVSRDKWRDYIKEFQEVSKDFTSGIISEENLENNKKFLTFVEEYKEELKEERKSRIVSGTYTGLNKQLGDITFSVATPHKWDSTEAVFKKKVFKISDLSKTPRLTVVFQEEERELASRLFRVGKNIGVVLVGKREIRKLPKLHNFINLNEFLMSKKFSKIVTSIEISNLLEKYDELNNNEIVEHCMKKQHANIELLREYVDKNEVDTRYGEQFVKVMVEVAKERGDLWDKSIEHIYKAVQSEFEVFDFISMLVTPDEFDEEEVKKYNNIINKFLLFQKLKYGKFEDFDLVERIPQEAWESFEEQEKLIAA